MKRPWSRATLITIVVACFSIAAATNAYFHPFGFPDEADYWTLASNLVHSGTLSFNGVDPSAYRPPLVAWVLAPFAATGWPMEMVRPVFVIFYATTGALAGLFLCRIFISSRWIPPLGTALVLGHPVYFFAAGNLYPQEILAPLFMAALVLACHKPTSSHAILWRSTVIGLITAVSLLASAPAIFSLLPIFVLLVCEDLAALRQAKISQAYRVVVAGLVALVCVTPYFVRNARQVHPGIYLSLNSGINLLLGNSPRSTPTSGVVVDLSEYLRGHENDSEFDLNHYLTAVALANIKQDPGYYRRFYLRKFSVGLSSSVVTATYGYNRSITLALQSYMLFLWIGVGVLLVSFFRRSASAQAPRLDWPVLRISLLLTLTAYLLTIACYAVFFTRLRFRMPVDVALALLSAAGWGVLICQRKQQARHDGGRLKLTASVS